MKPTPLIELLDLRFAWPGQNQAVLHVPAWRLGAGERVFLHGPSGCGKSTLLSLIAGVLQPQSGCIRWQGQDLTALSASARDRFRGEHMGFIFQQFNLLPWMSALGNVLLAAQWSPARRAKLNDPLGQARALLLSLGISAADHHRPAATLSVGQQQRVATARALLGGPALLIADEPTSALDAAHQDLFIHALDECCLQHGSSLLFVSHDERLRRHFQRCESWSELQKVAQ